MFEADIQDVFLKLYLEYKTEAYVEYQRIESDYEKNAMDPSKALSVDFSIYARDWFRLNKQAKKKCAEVKEICDYRSKQGFNEKIDKSLFCIWLAYMRLEAYTMKMSGIASRLDIKAHGGEYTLDEYVKELTEAEKDKQALEEIHREAFQLNQ